MSKRASFVSPWACFFALLVTASGVLGSADARAETTEQNRQAAQESYRRALQLFDRAQHAAALVEFQRAYSLAPAFRILYNIGLTEVALGDARAAVEALTSYLKEGGERIPAARRSEVEAEIARLSKQLATLDVNVEQAGAELTVDGELLGQGPLARQLKLNAGRHTVAVRSPDGTLKTQSVNLSRGEAQQLEFREHQPVSVAGAQAPDQSGNAESESKASAPPTLWIAWGITGALGVGTVVAGVVALGAHGDESDLKARRGVTSDELRQAREKVEDWALAADVLLATTAVAAGVSLYLTLDSGRAHESRTGVLIGPGRVALRQTF